MKAAIEVLEKELRVLTIWAQDKDSKAIKEIQHAIDVLKQIIDTDGKIVPRKKPKWV